MIALSTICIMHVCRHEGRSWYSEHRGRLWIHAASKEPDSETILAAEQLYRELYDGKFTQVARKLKLITY